MMGFDMTRYDTTRQDKIYLKDLTMIWTQDIPTTPGIYLYKKRKNSKDTAIRSHVAIAEVKENTGWYLGPLSCGECVFWTQTGLLKSGRCKFFPTTSDEPKYRNDWCGQFQNGES